MAKRKDIILLPELASDKNLVGVYKIFAIRDEIKTCLYIEKSTNISYRLLGSGGSHIYMYLNNNFSKLVPFIIDKYINQGYIIQIEIMPVEYLTMSFFQERHMG